MLTDKQMGLLNHRMAGYIRKIGYDLPTFEKWARGNLETWTLNNLLEDIKKYESTWDEKHLEAFNGQVKHLYERNN